MATPKNQTPDELAPPEAETAIAPVAFVFVSPSTNLSIYDDGQLLAKFEHGHFETSDSAVADRLVALVELCSQVLA